MSEHTGYKLVQTLEFDRDVKDTNLKKINELLSQGWEIIDARIGQWSRPNTGSGNVPAGYWQFPEYCFILGKRQ